MLRQLLHTLKGTSGNLGAAEFPALCQQDLEILKDRDGQLPADWKEKLQSAFERLTRTLDTFSGS